jgi:PKD repeat protein
MTAKLFNTCIVLVTLTVGACTTKPKACFDFSRSDVKVNDTLTLVNCSTNYTDVRWSFPGGGTNSVPSPRIKLPSAGSYEVMLTVGNDNFKESSSLTRTIIVKP